MGAVQLITAAAPAGQDLSMSLEDAYQAGTSVNVLALNYRISRDTVCQHIKRAGVSFRQRGLTEEQKAEAERFYLAGWSLQRLAERLRAGRRDNPAESQEARRSHAESVGAALILHLESCFEYKHQIA